MGATYFSNHTRESVVIGAKFFRDDLPYFVEALAEVAGQTKYLGTVNGRNRMTIRNAWLTFTRL